MTVLRNKIEEELSTFTTEYSYDRDDRIARVRYNNDAGTQVTYIYDDLSRIETRKAYNGANTYPTGDGSASRNLPSRRPRYQ